MNIIQMSITASILIVVIVIIRSLALHRLTKTTFPILWSVVIFRLLVPISIPSRFSLYSGLDILKGLFAEKTSLSSKMIDIRRANMVGVGQFVPADISVAPLVSPIEIIWFVGMCLCIIFFSVVYIRCLVKFKRSLPMENDFTSLWIKENPLHRSVQIRQSASITAPLTYGIFRPVLLLPEDTDWGKERELRYIFTHEYTHIRRFDTLTKLVLTAALCVHWFNPLVWVMYILANRDIELSCDEKVVRSFGERVKSDYALTLIGLEEKKSNFVPLVNNFSKNAIEERIVSIMKIKKTSLIGISLAMVLIVGTTIVFATSASASLQNDKNDTKSYFFQDENGSGSILEGQNVQEAKRIEPADLDENTSFITKEEEAKMSEKILKPQERTEDELKQIIADIESGKIKPLDLESLSDDVSVTFIDSDGKETVLKKPQK